MENSVEAFRFESETLVANQKQEMRKKCVKVGVILILCLLLLNFVLVVVLMNWRELSPSCSKIDKQFEALEKEHGELRKNHEELIEQFESLSQNFQQLENNLSSNCPVLLLTPPPPARQAGPPGKNQVEKPKPIDSSVDIHAKKFPKSCSDALEILPSSRSKKQTIYLHGNNESSSLEVLCDFETDGGGWTIIQKRISCPKHEFQKNWDDYAKGFGSLDRNFWIGLENIHALTRNGDQELRIELEDFYGDKVYTKYSNFSISDSLDFYRLAVGGFSENSTAGDSLMHGGLGRKSNGMRFSTWDKDNDLNPGGNAAVKWGGGGGWWFNVWVYSNLNGLYFEKEEYAENEENIYWGSWKRFYPMKKSEMKIRTRKS